MNQAEQLLEDLKKAEQDFNLAKLNLEKTKSVFLLDCCNLNKTKLMESYKLFVDTYQLLVYKRVQINTFLKRSGR